MKKLVALLLALAMLCSVTACDRSGKVSNDDAEMRVIDNNADDAMDSDANENQNAASGEYQTFDDLTYEWDVNSDYLLWVDEVEGELYLRCDTPHEDLGLQSSIYGFYCYNSDLGMIFVSSGEYTPGLTVDDAFSDVYRDFFLATMDDEFNHSDWMDFTPDTTEHITVNGRDAIQFSGMQEADDYGTLYRYYVYGYCVVIENVPVIIAAVAADPELDYNTSYKSSDDMAKIKHYTDEMIYTLRALDHYEAYGDNK